MHDGAVRLLYHWFKAMGCVVYLEVDHLNPAKPAQRIDLYLVLPPGDIYLIDVAILDPICKTYINRAAEGIEEVTHAREKQKTAKYQAMANKTKATTVPFVITVFGGLGDTAKEFIQTAIQWAIAQTGTTWAPNDIVYGLERSLAVWVQVAAARMIQEGFMAVDRELDP